VQSPGILEDFGTRLHQAAYWTPSAIVNKDLDWTEFLGYPFVRRRDLLLHCRITLDRHRHAARCANLGSGFGDYIGTARDQRNLVAIGKTARESRAQAFADADYYTDPIPNEPDCTASSGTAKSPAFST
jgi:hypothetical protein